MKVSDDSPRDPAAGDQDAVETSAAHWLARREEGLSVDQQAAFSEWLLADPRHAAAAQKMAASWSFMQRPRASGQASLLIAQVAQRLRQRSRRRWKWAVLSASGLAAAAALAISFAPFERHEAAKLPLASSVEIKPVRQTLEDGSVVELNAGAEIEVGISSVRRSVRLLRGEAHFSVAKDANRPFVVIAGAIAVRAIGTEFAVHFEPAAVDVLVTEGRVAVERNEPAAGTALPDSSPTYVSAGNRTVVPIAEPPTAPLKVESIRPKDLELALGWRAMRVEFTATPLGEIVARFNRHNALQLILGDPAVESIRISGIFWVDDPAGFSRLIEQSAGLRATRESETKIVLNRP